jgi:hypothetical protein
VDTPRSSNFTKAAEENNAEIPQTIHGKKLASLYERIGKSTRNTPRSIIVEDRRRLTGS